MSAAAVQRGRGAVIIGSGGHGRGLLETLRRARSEEAVLGFVDDDPARVGTRVAGLPVLGTSEWLRAHRDRVESFYFGLGTPRQRWDAARRLAELDLRTPPLVHPRAVVHGDVELGPGAFVGAGAVIAHATRIGARVLINLNATIGHDVHVGAEASVGPGANLGGGVQIGEGAFVGMNATIPPGMEIGAWSEAAAGSVVLRAVRPGRRVLGNPARDLGPVDGHEEAGGDR
ncbi:MAG: hypothetical protein GF355_11140 [Candidatus Eisenbacteria bacterium]|nr:hypothetical protein [Candidatus Eisenbacteria bacterium]